MVLRSLASMGAFFKVVNTGREFKCGNQMCVCRVFVVLLCGRFCATVLSHVLFGTRVTHYKHKKKKKTLHTNISFSQQLAAESGEKSGTDQRGDKSVDYIKCESM